MGIEWYIKKGEQEKGPLSSADVRKLAIAGELEPTDLVRKSDMTKWARASAIKGLFPTEGAEALPATTSPRPSPVQKTTAKSASASPPSAGASPQPVKGKPATKPPRPMPVPASGQDNDEPVGGDVAASPRRRSHWVLYVCGVVAVAAIGVGVYFYLLNRNGPTGDFNNPTGPIVMRKPTGPDPMLTAIQVENPYQRKLGLQKVSGSDISDETRLQIRKAILDTLADKQYAPAWPDAARALAEVGQADDVKTLAPFCRGGGLEIQSSALAAAMILDPQAGVKLFEPHATDVLANDTIGILMRMGARSRAVGLVMLKSTVPQCRYRSFFLLGKFGVPEDLPAINQAKTAETDPRNIPQYQVLIDNINKRHP